MKITKLSLIYNYEKINSLFKNFDTMSFLDLIFNYKILIKNGYNKGFFKSKVLHSSAISYPFFFFNDCFSFYFTMNTLKKSDNFKFIILGLIIKCICFYFKDLSLALGQTDRIPLILGYLGTCYCFKFIYFYRSFQINEK